MKIVTFTTIEICSLFHGHVCEMIFWHTNTLRENPHMIYTPSFTLLYSKKGEIRGTQNESLFLVSCLASEKNVSIINNILKNPY